MICPKCHSNAVGKEVTRRGWSGDYACLECGYNNAKENFLNDASSLTETKKLKLGKKLRGN